MKPGGSNPAHRHPNCEEVLHVLEGDVEHYVEGIAFALCVVIRKELARLDIVEQQER